MLTHLGDGHVILSATEWDDLRNAYQTLYTMISDSPSGFSGLAAEDILAIRRWNHQLEGKTFVEQDHLDKGEEEDPNA